MTRVVIAGSGVAALEAVLALRALAGRGFEIDLLAPEHALVDRPASVRAPFGLGAAPSLDLHELASRYDVRLVQGELAGVDTDARLAWVEGGEALLYDHLLVAVGARPVPAILGGLTFAGPADARPVQWMLGEAIRGHRRRIAVAVPAAVTWPLPAYELAIMARTELDMQGGRDVAVTLVTAEPEPVAIFGEEAGAALRELLAQRRIRLRTGAAPEHVTGDVLWLESGEAVLADTVISLPRLEGPRIPGLPSDKRGFLPTDPHGRVTDRVLAAGDATDFPVKQGGLAAQQADAAAATIAVQLGARAAPRPFTRPVLRGVLLTGGAPLYLRAELDRSGEPVRGSISARALWSPPGKIAGRYLAPYLATARPPVLADEPLVDLWASTDPVCGRPPMEAARSGHSVAAMLTPEDMAPAIEARGIVKVFGEGDTEVRALDGVDLVVERGEMVAIMGPSGSGKSTLLHIVGALETPTDGTVAVAGQRYDGAADKVLTRLRRDHIGFIFQFFNLLPSLTAEENVLLPALIARRAGDATRERARMLLERVGLADRAAHTPGELSGGQQQRVSIARALLLAPELVLADEPTGNLDTRSGRDVLRALRDLNQAEGRTILMVTHDPSAAAVADRVVFLRDGRVAGEVAGGSTQRVIDFFATLVPAEEPEPAAA